MKIIRDTREQTGWFFEESNFCEGTVIQTLKTGDYTVEGYEDKICIERKASVSEFAGNCVEPRFERELERMTAYPYRYVILEFDMEQLIGYPYTAGKKVAQNAKITGKFILRKMIEFQIKYDIHFILAGKYGKETALSVMKRGTNN